MQLAVMTKYLDLVRDFVQQHYTDTESFYQEELAHGISEEEFEGLYGRYVDDSLDAGVFIPQFALSSFVVMWYAFIEQSLLDLCEELNLCISVQPKDTTRLGTGIDRARRFLIEGRAYEIDRDHWQELTTVRRVRNILVHQGRQLTYQYWPLNEQKHIPYELEDGRVVYVYLDEYTLDYMKRHNILGEVIGVLQIVPPFEYCEHLVRFATQLLRNMYRSLPRVVT